ncbi:translation elongation factor [Bifidobacterium actinocoloniiforme DSM 22766]|uniref:Translation elongation factor n=2 Tax=Bifidobacterium actinocoloniiforme TaxID=638619 RepID=A0A086Z1P6_9BIFI|nr:GTP-binding protein [Bifidobacterium actinocoloniiforme DSM 22766]KFI40446.1 translation elongation factor [Bifidobacterium actinocoloniiforme DSM 22766]
MDRPRRIVLGILAHVDAGKTTLAEAMLYQTGRIRKLGRVDHGDAFLDTDGMEKERGITIFAKQALLEHGDLAMTLLDTPGHADFSAEMERTLGVLDYAILVVSAPDGVRGQEQTLWRLLERYKLPVFVFVNKMDAPQAGRQALLEQLGKRLGKGFVDCSAGADPARLEETALLSEAALEEFLEQGRVSDGRMRDLIARRRLFPVYFGSALRLDGVQDLLEGLGRYTREPDRGLDFGARVFKISHDKDGGRLTWIKVTGGDLAVKAMLTGAARDANEKVDQIRLYSGARFSLVNHAQAGMVCALTGLDTTHPGEGLGAQGDGVKPLSESVLTYTVLPGEANIHQVLAALRLLADEDPLLRVRWVERLGQVRLQLMGKVQLEVVREELKERFGLEVDFGPGSILYKETIAAPVEGVGHFEPLRHYAEVHLLMEPSEPGSGLAFASAVSLDDLPGNWQRLILGHLREKEHLGVLTGSPITDMRITLVAARGHEKHTEGGDFRQATYRAVRQGLMHARNVLLEPWYSFRLELPQEQLGRAMSDIQRMSGSFDAPDSEGDYAVVTGSAPVSQMRDYALDVTAYTHGQGQLTCLVDGYRPCHDADAVIAARNYDPEADLENTPDSVFCAHGAGYPVKWSRVPDFMHLPGGKYL